MQSSILLIDDEPEIINLYLRALRLEGFDLKEFRDVDSAFDFINKEKPKIDAIVLDLMMNPGKRYQSEDTQDGLSTGVLTFHELRRLYPKVPVLVLTNHSEPELLRPLYGKYRTKVIQKLDHSPFDVAKLMREMIEVAGSEMNREDSLLYVYIDGDGVGDYLELLLQDNNLSAAIKFSESITLAISDIQSMVDEIKGAQVLISGGDDMIFSIPGRSWAGQKIEALREVFHQKTGLTMSGGVGYSAKMALESLRQAKLSGKNQITEADGVSDENPLHLH